MWNISIYSKYFPLDVAKCSIVTIVFKSVLARGVQLILSDEHNIY